MRLKVLKIKTIFLQKRFGQVIKNNYLCTRKTQEARQRLNEWKRKKRDHWNTIYNQVKNKNQSEVNFEWVRQTYNGEFDPGSGWTLAGGLTHASRAVLFLRKWESGVRVRNTCATCLYLEDSLSKGRLILYNILIGINWYWKLRWIEMGTRKIS